MSPIQGGMINWFAHKSKFPLFYRNHSVPNHSVNILPVDFLFLGEAYHNNHHYRPNAMNLRVRWHELDIMYHMLRVLGKLNLIVLH